MSTLILFEPQNLAPFGPMVLLQSVADLRYGIYSNIERTQKIFPGSEINLWVRPILSADQGKKHQGIPINQDVADDALYLNAALPAWLYPKAIEKLENKNNSVLIQDGIIIAAKSKKRRHIFTNISF